MAVGNSHRLNSFPLSWGQWASDFGQLEREMVKQPKLFHKQALCLRTDGLSHFCRSDVRGINENFGNVQGSLIDMKIIDCETRNTEWLRHIICLTHANSPCLEGDGRVQHLEGGAHFVKPFGGAVEARICADLAKMVRIEIWQ